MIYYGNPVSEEIREAMVRGQLGCIATPGQGNYIDPRWDTIIDNGCFNSRWTRKPWLEWLDNRERNVRFAVAPDLYDKSGAPCHEETLERWYFYAPIIRLMGFQPAFVCQQGSTPDNLPLDSEFFFLGGSDEFKLGHGAFEVALAVKQRGLWLHMGRVNSRKRLKIARSMGCDSVDGTYLTYGPSLNFPKLMRWMGQAERDDNWI